MSHCQSGIFVTLVLLGSVVEIALKSTPFLVLLRHERYPVVQIDALTAGVREASGQG